MTVLLCRVQSAFCTRVAMSPRQDRQLVIRSEQFPGHFALDLDDLPKRSTGDWCDYVLGIAVVLQQTGHPLQGANLFVHGEIPTGAGLSSSAAIEVASALALISLNGAVFPLVEVAKLCRHTENAFIGARVGIMDQLVSCLGRAMHSCSTAVPSSSSSFRFPIEFGWWFVTQW